MFSLLLISPNILKVAWKLAKYIIHFCHIISSEEQIVMTKQGLDIAAGHAALVVRGDHLLS